MRAGVIVSSFRLPTDAALERASGCDGYLTIEREVGADPKKSVRAAVQFLPSLGV